MFYAYDFVKTSLCLFEKTKVFTKPSYKSATTINCASNTIVQLHASTFDFPANPESRLRNQTNYKFST